MPLFSSAQKSGTKLSRSSIRRAFLAIAAVLLVIELLGAADLDKRPYSGLTTGDGSRVTKVARASPAERAGKRMVAELTYSALPPGDIAVQFFYAVLGFAFLGIGLTALFRTSTAALSLAFGMAHVHVASSDGEPN